MESEFASVKEVARAYGRNVEMVRRWCRIGVLEGAMHAGRDWRIPAKYAAGNVEIIIPGKRRDWKARKKGSK